VGMHMSFSGYPDNEVLNVIDKLTDEDVYVLTRTFGIPVDYTIIDYESPMTNVRLEKND
jgi:hypothetical protein